MFDIVSNYIGLLGGFLGIILAIFKIVEWLNSRSKLEIDLKYGAYEIIRASKKNCYTDMKIIIPITFEYRGIKKLGIKYFDINLYDDEGERIELIEPVSQPFDCSFRNQSHFQLSDNESKEYIIRFEGPFCFFAKSEENIIYSAEIIIYTTKDKYEKTCYIYEEGWVPPIDMM